MRNTTLSREGLSVVEAAEVSGIGRTKIFGLIAEGSLKARKVGHKTIILRSELMAFLENLPRADVTKAA
jgi:excisionase family DNA binding protein